MSTDTLLPVAAGTRLPRRLPLLFALGVLVIFFVAMILGASLTGLLVGDGPHADDWRGVGGEAGAALAMIATVALTRSWWVSGFTGRRHWRRTSLVLLPLVLVVVNLVAAAIWDVLRFDPGYALPTTIDMLLTGFAEEVALRGLILGALLVAWRHRRGGFTAAVVVSSLIFAVFHLVNLAGGAPLIDTLAQVIYTFGMGLTFAVVRLGTRTIWLAALMHGVVDVSSSSFLDPDADQPAALLWVVTVCLLLLGLLAWRLLRREPEQVLWADALAPAGG